MARMIPSIIDPDHSPPGELTIFRLLRDETPKSWIVMHSLDLPRHIRQIQGEIDFFVLVPGLAAICLEIKSHEYVRRNSVGLWCLGSEEPTMKSPFKQSSDAMHSLRQQLKSAPDLADVPFMAAVGFPRCSFDVPATEWEPWQVFDERRLEARGIEATIRSIGKSLREKLRVTPSAGWFRPEAAAPTEEQCEIFVRSLRSSFERNRSPKARRSEREQEIRRYTEEQFRALDAIEENPRLVFWGGAGTGKTFLALEVARRAVLRERSVLLCCYNQLLGSWLRAETVPLGGEVEAGTLHSLMLRITGLSAPQNPSRDFWTRELPLRTLEVLLEGHELQNSFDTLLIDEAQDLCSEEYLDVLDLLVKGGLAGGEVMAFGDFDFQAIFARGGERIDGRVILQSRLQGFSYSLKDNCRNRPRVGSIAASAAGVDPYAAYLRPDDGVEVKIYSYSGRESQVEALISAIETLRKEHYQLGDIAILSRLAGDAAWQHLPKSQSDRLAPASPRGWTKIRTSSIQAFKGMEATAVIVTDLDSLSSIESRHLLYVAATRATDRLVLVLNNDAMPEMTQLTIGGIE